MVPCIMVYYREIKIDIEKDRCKEVERGIDRDRNIERWIEMIIESPLLR